ncbi:uncharacterized protein FSUBG_12351 [Fusarium subglutinans]|uniref:Uncharacterized protein n=1 Tax=Gibberella subglutinans TaxID=42677 RepID=A0A8H5L5L2_GIBSU|nr:uncharacterized protein FSUBG_12351 [Fusarium subglutinans]KAF5585762.1 hypothetical protein FSUBG_12351 [Fusarium subglutinans]
MKSRIRATDSELRRRSGGPQEPPPPPRSQSLAAIHSRPAATSIRALERSVQALKAEKDREVQKNRAILDEKQKLETENAALVLEAQKLRAEKAQMELEIQNLKDENQVMQTEKELQEAEVQYKCDVIERLKGVLRRHHLL